MRTQETHNRAALHVAPVAFRPAKLFRRLPEAFRAVWMRVLDDDCIDMAAQVSFYFVLSMFPFFLVVAAIVGWLPSTTIWQQFVHWIMLYVPRLSRTLLFATILDLTHGQTGFLSFGLFTAIWSASSGFASLMEALTTAYGSKDTRGFWTKRILAIGATIGAALFFLLSFGLWSIGHWAAALSPALRAVVQFQSRWDIAWWLVTVLLACLGVDLINYLLPDVKRRWHWLTPGTFLVVLSFILSSLAFNFYVRHSPMLPRVYGTLAGFIILMMWIYVSTLILLVGAEIDRMIEIFQQRGAPA